jgi:hypothetical protein
MRSNGTVSLVRRAIQPASIVVLVCVTVVGRVQAQSAPAPAATPPAPALTLEGMKTPTSPAFALLGVSPTTVERPTTPQGLAVGLFTSATKSADLIPRDYSLEVAPYWLKNHPALSHDTYFAPGTAQSIAQTLSFSFVTSKPTDGSPDGTTDIGFGVRTSLRAGHASQKVRELLKTLAKDHVKWHVLTLALGRIRGDLPAQPASPLPTSVEQVLKAPIKMGELSPEEVSAVVAELRKSLTSIWATATDRRREPIRLVLEALELIATEPSDPTALEAWKKRRAELLERVRNTPAALDGGDAAARIMADLATLESAFTTTSRDIQAKDLIRRGLIISLAAAVASRVPAAGGLRDARLRQHGGWATIAYRTDGPLIDFIALARVIARAPEVGQDVFDFGGQFVHQPSEFAWSVEYVQRIEADDAPSTQRVAVNAEYKLRDNVFLTAAFGKDFANASLGRPKGGLVSVLGVNFGFSGKSVIQLPSTKIGS